MNKRVLFVLLMLLSPTSWANEADVSRLLFGEIMYNRFQENNFDAISRYLAGRESGELVLTPNNAAYIASIYLNYDLHSQARDMLELLINNPSASIRDLSWYYLGKLHYRDNRVQSAVDTFANIQGALPADEQEMKYIMYGIMSVNVGQYETAIEQLSKVPASSHFHRYVSYNIAIARARLNHDVDQLAKSLTILLPNSKDNVDDDVVFSDQIYTTLGYVYLQNKNYNQATAAFRHVSLQGHLTTRALQGMIYAASESGQYEKALNLSLQLIRMTIGNEAIHNAYVVIPYVLQQLDNTDKATAFYQHAVVYFSEQRIALENYVHKINRGEFDQYLLEQDKIFNAEQWIDDDEMSRLFRFVSTLNEWRDAVHKYKEMQYVQKRLDDWFYNLVIIEADVQQQNRARYQELLSRLETQKKQVAESLVWHRKHARRFVLAALEKQLDDVTDYLGQARFALAQFYDQQELREKQLQEQQLQQQQQQLIDSNSQQTTPVEQQNPQQEPL